MAVRQINGWHVLVGFGAAFGLIIGVNLLLAWNAVKTFPGLEVKNSYVASQQFDVRKTAQEGLGWQIHADHADDTLRLAIKDAQGNPVKVRELRATVGRATHVQDDQTPTFTFDGSAYIAPVILGDGNWNIRMIATASDGTEFRQRVQLLKQ